MKTSKKLMILSVLYTIKESVLNFLSGLLLSIAVSMALSIVEPTGIKTVPFLFVLPIILMNFLSILFMVIATKIGPIQHKYDDIKKDDDLIARFTIKAKDVNGNIWVYLVLKHFSVKRAILLSICLIISFLMIFAAIIVPIVFSML